MSDITLFKSTLPADAFIEASKDFDKTAPRADAGGVPLLRMLKQDGSWVYGKDNIEVEEGGQFAIDPSSLAQGYIAWHMMKVEGERMSAMGQPAVDPADLPPVQAKNGWEAQVAFGLIAVGGEDDGTAVLWKVNTKGGIDAWNAIYDSMKARAAAQKPYAPIVELDHTSYKHPEYGMIYKPVFNIVGWVGDEEEVPQVEDKPAPRKRARRA